MRKREQGKVLSFKGLLSSLKGGKKLEKVAIALLLLAVIAIIIWPVGTDTPAEGIPPSTTPEATSLSDAQQLEQKLTKVLSSIRGAGKVEVMITYESTAEQVPVLDTDLQINQSEQNDPDGGQRSEQTTTENNRTVTVNAQGSVEPFISKRIEPEIRGVIVVAEGAENLSVYTDLLGAVSTVLHVPVDRVEIFVMHQEISE